MFATHFRGLRWPLIDDLLLNRMTRQINPALFGEMGHIPRDSVDGFMPPQSPNQAPGMPLFDAIYEGPLPEELQSTLEKLRSETEQALKTLGLRIEKVAGRAGATDERLNGLVKDLQERLSFILSRLKEHTGNEHKMESLIERHNQIVQNFELRLGQAQRVIENQSLQLAKQQTMIDDATRYIEKLKRL